MYELKYFRIVGELKHLQTFFVINNMINSTILKSLFVVVLLLLLATPHYAQCPMCRMTLESNLKNGGRTGIGMNLGILYLLFTPYIIGAGIAYVWWRNKKKAGNDLLNNLS